MNVYLAGFKTIQTIYDQPTDEIYLLSSFYEHRNGKYGDYVFQKRHMLDSGAFSALSGVANNVDWDVYVNNYIKFIRAIDSRLFFELDLDNIVGLKRVEYYRKKIQDGVGISPIPVWHRSRGKEYWLQMIEESDYVAIGGIALREILPREYIHLRWFIQTAHDAGVKIHALGFTSIPWLHILKFDSVDSTTWIVGKYGNVCVIDNYKDCRQRKPQGKRVKNVCTLHLHNFNEWVKFQKYAEKSL